MLILNFNLLKYFFYSIIYIQFFKDFYKFYLYIFFYPNIQIFKINNTNYISNSFKIKENKSFKNFTLETK